MERERILEALYGAVDEVNMTLPEPKRIAKSPDAPLRDAVESITVVNLIVEAEMALDMAGITVDLSDRTAVPEGMEPLATLGTLADYVAHRITEAQHG